MKKPKTQQQKRERQMTRLLVLTVTTATVISSCVSRETSRATIGISTTLWAFVDFVQLMLSYGLLIILNTIAYLKNPQEDAITKNTIYTFVFYIIGLFGGMAMVEFGENTWFYHHVVAIYILLYIGVIITMLYLLCQHFKIDKPVTHLINNIKNH